MPRPTRIEYENALYHVMNRGRARNNIFFKEVHYSRSIAMYLCQKYKDLSLIEIANIFNLKSPKSTSNSKGVKPLE